jgi:hypothetical protein
MASVNLSGHEQYPLRWKKTTLSDGKNNKINGANIRRHDSDPKKPTSSANDIGTPRTGG